MRDSFIPAILAILCSSLLTVFAVPAQAANPVEIAGPRLLFLDHGMLSRCEGAKLQVNLARGEEIVNRYVQRIDSFVSLDFGAPTGECSTVPIRGAGENLLGSLDTRASEELQIGLLDETGRPGPGGQLGGINPADDQCPVCRGPLDGESRFNNTCWP